MGFSHTLYVSKATSSGETPGLVVTIDFPPANFLLGLAHWYLPWLRGSRHTERFSVGCRQKTPLPKSSPRPSGDGDGRDASYSIAELGRDTSPSSAVAAGAAPPPCAVAQEGHASLGF